MLLLIFIDVVDIVVICMVLGMVIHYAQFNHKQWLQVDRQQMGKKQIWYQIL